MTAYAQYCALSGTVRYCALSSTAVLCAQQYCGVVRSAVLRYCAVLKQYGVEPFKAWHARLLCCSLHILHVRSLGIGGFGARGTYLSIYSGVQCVQDNRSQDV